MSLDGTGIRGVQDWMGMSALLDKKILQNSSDSHYFKGFGAVDSRKGYCVPNAMLGDSKKVEYADNQSVCPYDRSLDGIPLLFYAPIVLYLLLLFNLFVLSFL